MCGSFNLGQTENGKLLFTTHLLQKMLMFAQNIGIPIV